MTSRFVGGIAVAMLAVGVLTGAAGTIVVRDATSPEANLAAVMTDHMSGAGMGSMMSSSMMAGGSMMGAEPSISPQDHQAHHAMPSPEPTR